jgi:hypothetical protein
MTPDSPREPRIGAVGVAKPTQTGRGTPTALPTARASRKGSPRLASLANASSRTPRLGTIGAKEEQPRVRRGLEEVSYIHTFSALTYLHAAKPSQSFAKKSWGWAGLCECNPPSRRRSCETAQAVVICQKQKAMTSRRRRSLPRPVSNCRENAPRRQSRMGKKLRRPVNGGVKVHNG